MLAPVEKKVHQLKGALTGSKLEVADIFRLYGSDYRTGQKLSLKQRQVMFDIEHCRTSYFGYHVDVCDHCGAIDSGCNSCRNRHCPKCQGVARRIWVNARLKDLLPVSYYHVVFTLPHLINPLVGWNREFIYTLLFDCAAQTLLQFGRDPKWLGALIGFYGILHTWGGKMWQHLHTHFIVPGGGLTEDDRWVEPKYKGKFLFPVKAMSKVFRGKFIKALKRAYLTGQLVLSDGLRHLSDGDRFEQWLDILVARNWVVYAKAPFDSAEKVVRYIGRYTHRIAISNQRLIKVEDGIVHFRYKDYRNKGRWKTARLKAQEFIRRFLLHVVPDGFHRIRHYGLFANGRCKKMVCIIRQLLDVGTDNLPEPDIIGIECKACGIGRLRTLFSFHLFGSTINRFVTEAVAPKLILDSS